MYIYIYIYIRLELPKLCYHPGWRLMRLGYRTCFHTLYDEKLNTKTLWKARWLFGKTKWLFRKLEWHPGKTGILTNMDNTMKEKCPQGVCSGEGEYITHLTCSYGNDLDMYPATTCDCGRKFNSLRGHESTRRAGAKNVILLPENVNRLMGLWVRFTPTVFTSPLLTISVLETFFASQEFSGPRVIR